MNDDSMPRSTLRIAGSTAWAPDIKRALKQAESFVSGAQAGGPNSRFEIVVRIWGADSVENPPRNLDDAEWTRKADDEFYVKRKCPVENLPPLSSMLSKTLRDMGLATEGGTGVAGTGNAGMRDEAAAYPTPKYLSTPSPTLSAPNPAPVEVGQSQVQSSDLGSCDGSCRIPHEHDLCLPPTPVRHTSTPTSQQQSRPTVQRLHFPVDTHMPMQHQGPWVPACHCSATGIANVTASCSPRLLPPHPNAHPRSSPMPATPPLPPPPPPPAKPAGKPSSVTVTTKSRSRSRSGKSQSLKVKVLKIPSSSRLSTSASTPAAFGAVKTKPTPSLPPPSSHMPPNTVVSSTAVVVKDIKRARVTRRRVARDKQYQWHAYVG